MAARMVLSVSFVVGLLEKMRRRVVRPRKSFRTTRTGLSGRTVAKRRWPHNARLSQGDQMPAPSVQMVKALLDPFRKVQPPVDEPVPDLATVMELTDLAELPARHRIAAVEQKQKLAKATFPVHPEGPRFGDKGEVIMPVVEKGKDWSLSVTINHDGKGNVMLRHRGEVVDVFPRPNPGS